MPSCSKPMTLLVTKYYIFRGLVRKKKKHFKKQNKNTFVMSKKYEEELDFIYIESLNNNWARLTVLETTGRVATVRENIWKMKLFPGQGKVGEYCGWPGKYRKDLKSQGKIRECDNKWLW